MRRFHLAYYLIVTCVNVVAATILVWVVGWSIFNDWLAKRDDVFLLVFGLLLYISGGMAGYLFGKTKRSSVFEQRITLKVVCIDLGLFLGLILSSLIIMVAWSTYQIGISCRSGCSM